MENKTQILKAKLLRFLRITKPIQLSEAQVKFIKLCKLHYRNDPRFSECRGWIEVLKPLHYEIYGWHADEDGNYHDFLGCMFNALFDIHRKISLDYSGSDSQLKSIIRAGFEKSFAREHELPIERVIAELCGQIQNNQVIEHGVNRYCL